MLTYFKKNIIQNPAHSKKRKKADPQGTSLQYLNHNIIFRNEYAVRLEDRHIRKLSEPEYSGSETAAGTAAVDMCGIPVSSLIFFDGASYEINSEPQRYFLILSV